MKREHGAPAIRVAVAAPFPEIVQIHESTAEYADEIEVCAMISTPDAVLEQARLLQPDVLLLSDELGPARGDTLTRLEALAPSTRLVMLVRDRPGATPVIADGMVATGAPPATLRAAILAAVGREVPAPAPPAHTRVPGQQELPEAIPARPSAVAATTTAPTAPASAPQPATAPVEHAAGPAAPGATEPHGGAPSRTVVVFSGKGGVGKSVIATNLATLLAVRRARVALVDLDLQYGDVGVLLHLEAHPVTIDMLAQRDRLDPAAIDDALATSAQGVRALLAPASPESSDLVSAAALEAILGQLSAAHDYVVVDCPPHLEERVVGVLEVADQILLVSSFGITSVKDAKVTLRLLQSLGVEPGRVSLVVNQTRSRISFPAEDIAGALRFPIVATLPYEPRMDESVDSGRPLVVSEPRSAFARQLALVADHVGREMEGSVKVRRHAARWRLRFRH